MNALVLLAHPKKGSFNNAIADTVRLSLEKKGHAVQYHDLYEEGFDPLLQEEELSGDFVPRGLLKEHCHQLSSADGIVVIHPNWRDQAPAILKGWVDRVIRTGVAFRFEGEEGEAGDYVPLLTGIRAVVFNTSDCTRAEEEKLGDPLEAFWKEHVFRSCGIEDTRRRNFCEVFTSTPDTRRKWLEEVEVILDGSFGLSK